MSVAFDFRLTGSGWARGRFVIGGEDAELTASYLGDALGELLRAVKVLADGAVEARASWDEEPGEWRWIFSRTADGVRVTIRDFLHMRGVGRNELDEDGAVVFDAECRLVDLVQAIAAGARRVLDQHGLDGYREEWIQHPFPEDDLAALEGWLK